SNPAWRPASQGQQIGCYSSRKRARKLRNDQPSLSGRLAQNRMNIYSLIPRQKIRRFIWKSKTILPIWRFPFNDAVFQFTAELLTR
ncbi:MAG: hypothetical protein LBE79_02540, partial [Tannerella sp.]|nr:hypothetical protein [Tannerella sp.]